MPLKNFTSQMIYFDIVYTHPSRTTPNIIHYEFQTPLGSVTGPTDPQPHESLSTPILFYLPRDRP